MRVLRTQLLIGFFVVALAFYFVMLGRIGIGLIGDGRAVSIGLGVALLAFPLIGAWALIATLRAGLAHQRLARRAADAGAELEVSDLPRRASGRIQRDAADALFEQVRAELDADPGDWLRWYRVARAYDYAGDRSRAREAMRRAVELESAEPQP